MKALPAAFIHAIPKTDLHVHLDGSLRLETLIELAKEAGVPLPSEEPDGLLEHVFRARYKSLDEYLAGFRLTVPALQSLDALERVAFELAEDNIAEGVRYLEVRFAPQLHVEDGSGIPAVLEAVDRGLARAAEEFNARGPGAGPDDIPFHYGIIVCALRMFAPEFSDYYRRFTAALNYSSARELHSMASMEIARAAVWCRDELGLPVVGFDLAGHEHGFPPEHHADAYHYAHRHFMKKTVHAGEAYGPESIFQAITELYADRIGHGSQLFRTGAITSGQVGDRDDYVRDLAEYIADRRVTIEVCLTSNMQTMPELLDLRDHPLRRMMQEKLSVTLCTDNRLVSRTTVTAEIEKAVAAFDLDARSLRDLVIYGFKRSFFPGSYREKRAYVRRVIQRYDDLQEQHGIV